MGYKTYLVMFFGTNGDLDLKEIVKRVEKLGFESSMGPVDFVYDWKDKKPTKQEIFEIGNKLLKDLKGANVSFNLDTHN